MQLLHDEFFRVHRSEVFFYSSKFKKVLYFLVAWLVDVILIAKDQLVIAY